MFQKTVIAGNLGRDPEMRCTPAGQAVTHLSVAANRRWTGNDGQGHEETAWFNVSVWGKQAETCNRYLHKGSKVLAEGRLAVDKETGGPRAWLDQAGKPRAGYELAALEVRFLADRDDGDSSELPPDADIEGGDTPF